MLLMVELMTNGLEVRSEHKMPAWFSKQLTELRSVRNCESVWLQSQSRQGKRKKRNLKIVAIEGAPGTPAAERTSCTLATNHL